MATVSSVSVFEPKKGESSQAKLDTIKAINEKNCPASLANMTANYESLQILKTKAAEVGATDKDYSKLYNAIGGSLCKEINNSAKAVKRCVDMGSLTLPSGTAILSCGKKNFEMK